MDKPVRLLSAIAVEGIGKPVWHKTALPGFLPVKDNSSLSFLTRAAFFFDKGGFAWITQTKDAFKVYTCRGNTKREDFEGLAGGGVMGARVEGVIVPMTWGTKFAAAMFGPSLTTIERKITAQYLKSAWQTEASAEREFEFLLNHEFSPLVWLDKISGLDISNDNRELAEGLQLILNKGDLYFVHSSIGTYLSKFLEQKNLDPESNIDNESKKLVRALREVHTTQQSNHAVACLASSLGSFALKENGPSPYFTITFSLDVKEWQPRFPIQNNGLRIDIPSQPLALRDESLLSFKKWSATITEPAWRICLKPVLEYEQLESMPVSFLELAKGSYDSLLGLIQKYTTAWDGEQISIDKIDTIIKAISEKGDENLFTLWEHHLLALAQNKCTLKPDDYLLVRAYVRIRIYTPCQNKESPLRKFLVGDIKAQPLAAQLLIKLDATARWPRKAAKWVDSLLNNRNTVDTGHCIAKYLADKELTGEEIAWLKSLISQLLDELSDNDAVKLADRLWMSQEKASFILKDTVFIEKICNRAVYSRHLDVSVPQWQILFEGFQLKINDITMFFARPEEESTKILSEFVHSYSTGKGADSFRTIMAARNSIPDDCRDYLLIASKKLFGIEPSNQSPLRIFCDHKNVNWHEIGPFFRAENGWFKDIFSAPSAFQNVAQVYQAYLDWIKIPPSIQAVLTRPNLRFYCNEPCDLKSTIDLVMLNHRLGSDNKEIELFILKHVVFSQGRYLPLETIAKGVIYLSINELEASPHVTEMLKDVEPKHDWGPITQAIQEVYSDFKERSLSYQRLLDCLPEQTALKYCLALWEQGELTARTIQDFSLRNENPAYSKALEEIRKKRKYVFPSGGFVVVRAKSFCLENEHDASKKPWRKFGPGFTYLIRQCVPIAKRREQ